MATSPRTSPYKETASENATPDNILKEEDKIQYDSKLKPSRDAIPTAEEALKIANAFVLANKGRIDRDAYIVKQRGNGTPYDAEKLKNSGGGWQSNISAGFLGAFVARISPAFLKAVNSSKSVTAAGIPEDSYKTNVFQEDFTKFLRKQENYQNLLTDIIDEDSLLGRAVLRYPDKFTIRPKFYSTSNALLPEGCSQNVNEIPLMVFVDATFVHEFVEMIKDKEVSEVNGWDIPNCVVALNKATSKDDRTQDRHRAYEDWISQGAYTQTFGEEQPKKVLTYTILAQEPDEEGKVSEMTVLQDKEKGGALKLYYQKNKYEKMSDAVCLFTYTRENGTAHGSKGLGRLILNHHEAYNRNFNKLVDDTFLNGMRCIELPERQKLNLGLKVQNPFIITGPGVKSTPMNLNINVEAFYAVVRQITTMAEQTAGAYVPATLLPTGSSDKTATEATIEKSEQEQIKEGVLGRFLSQFGAFVWTQQRRILDAETYLPECKEFQASLIEKGLTTEDFKLLRESNPMDNIIDYSGTARNSRIASFFQNVGKGNPAYDQQKLAKLVAEVSVDNQFADEICIVNSDPSVDADAIRMQDMESSSMLGSGLYIPTSPLDNDLVHMAAMQETMTVFMQNTQMMDKSKLSGMQAMLKHAASHIEQANAKGVKGKEISGFEQFLKVIVKQLQDHVKQLEQLGSQVASKLPQLLGGQANQLPQGESSVPVGGVGSTPAGAIGGMEQVPPNSGVTSIL
jgi:hypothetical protein